MAAVDERDCLLTLVESSSGLALVAKLPHRTVTAVNRAAVKLIHGSGLPFKTITWDNGTEFHGYRALEEATAYAATSRTRTAHGNAAATRTSMGCCGSISPSDAASPARDNSIAI